MTAVAPPKPRRRSLDVAAVLGQTFRLYGKHLPTFVMVMLLVHTPLILGAAALFFAGNRPDLLALAWLPLSAGSALVTNVGTAALVWAVFQDALGRSIDAGRSLSAGLARALPVLGVAFLAGLLSGVGFLFCIVPGLVIQSALYVAVPVTVLQRVGVLDSLQRSYELTQGNLLNVFAVLLVIGLIQFAASMISQFAFIGLMRTDPILAQQLQICASLAVSIGLGSLYAISQAAVYLRLRTDQDGLDEEALAQIFA